MKKFLALIMSAVMFASCGIVTFAQNFQKAELKFNSDGKFKIFLIADFQDGYPINKDYIEYLSEALDDAKPDLVIFLGDNIMRPDDGTEASYWAGYDQALTPIVSRKIPFTLVFGNHDAEACPSATKEQMLEKYMSYSGCLAYDAEPSLHGCGTHNLEIRSSDGSYTAFNLWMMDSGSYVKAPNSTSYYDCVRADQIDWYGNVSKQLESDNGNKKVPSLMFQHIVPEEVCRNVMLASPVSIDKRTKDFHDGYHSLFIPNFKNFTGNLFEPPCPSLDNDGQWKAISERGDVMAMFFGHDHTNSFKTTVDGVDAINVPAAIFSDYKSFIEQGGMLVTLDEKNPWSYDTQLICSNDLALKKGSKLPGVNHSKAEYLLSKICRVLYNSLITFIRSLLGWKV